MSRCDYPQKPGDCNVSMAAADAAAAIAGDIFSFRLPNIRSGSNGETDLYLNFGDDFTTENAVAYFSYIDALIAAFNSDPAKRFNAFYSTPAMYMAAKLASLPSLPVYTSDFMPYNDDPQGHNLWTGYYTSRPAFKGFVRESSSLLQSARQMQALVGGVVDLGPGNPLFKLERAMGVAQHHDSIAGTAMQNVNDDYAKIVEGG
jgi:lysosomal alpha-mannosidase